jgi:hypothetical protein
MGGLITRYALGVLAGLPVGGGGTPPPGTLLGGRLRARCLVTIATPHLACSSSHPEEVGRGPGAAPRTRTSATAPERRLIAMLGASH